MRDKIRQAYRTQKTGAKIRGIDWQFTYEEWVKWWGDDIHKRGKGSNDLVMARYNDTGAYHPNNCKKITFGENVAEANKMRIVSKETRKKIGEASRITNTGRTRITSEETKAKISAANKGKSAWNKGISPSFEAEQKRIESLKQYYAMRNSTQELHINTN